MLLSIHGSRHHEFHRSTALGRVLLAFRLMVFAAATATAADTIDLDLANLPRLANGVPAYPPPFMAIAKTPGIIPQVPNSFTIHQRFGYVASFSGFVDVETGQFGYPGRVGHAPLSIAYDDEKITFNMNIGLPYGRQIRAATTDPDGDMTQDDTVELLIAPLGKNGQLKHAVHRVQVNAIGTCRTEIDDPAIGQYHRPWSPEINCGAGMYQKLWRIAVQIPFEELGGKPDDGEIWGIQMAIRYAAPKIVAVLSPSNSEQQLSDEWKQFAKIRFDHTRRVNYRAHYFQAHHHIRRFTLQTLYSNGGNESGALKTHARFISGTQKMTRADVRDEVPPLQYYWYPDNRELRLDDCQLATPEEKNSVVRVTVVDPEDDDRILYDQWIPYWQREPGERDWLKEFFAKEFTFLTGTYPSKGIVNFDVQAQTLKKSNPDAAEVQVQVRTKDKLLNSKTFPLPQDGRIVDSLDLGRFQDGETYTFAATVITASGERINTKTDTFTRKIMPFENAPRRGLSDIVPSPFIPPAIAGNAVSCWARTYRHGAEGLLISLIAAKAELLARPARFLARVGDGKTIALTGTMPELEANGNGKVAYAQMFHGGGLKLKLTGIFDYDGFYRFQATMGPGEQPIELQELKLEIPVNSEHAKLIDAQRSFRYSDWETCDTFFGIGAIPVEKGRVWESKRFRYHRGHPRKGNMPPFIWLGDDERGLVFSCVSEAGMSNDDELPAVALDRREDEMILSVWAVNKPIELKNDRTFEFALQASPFKPLPTNSRLWRTTHRNDPIHGVYDENGTFFNTGWGGGSGAYPTYGRFLSLETMREFVQKIKTAGYDIVPAKASANSECGGTPEYLQFWHEWGSPLGWDKVKRSSLPEYVTEMFDAHGVSNPSPLVMVESVSNSCESNIDYRSWWLNEEVKHAGINAVYQDNTPFAYWYQPNFGLGYTREDGAEEATSVAWRSRSFMKRVKHLMEENNIQDSPGVFANIISGAVPGRSFCGAGLTGENPYSDKMRADIIRVYSSKQWGINLAWLWCAPSTGAARQYYRTTCSRLFLLDITNFTGHDPADNTNRWWQALDVFWLDDPSVLWHPYYTTDLVESTKHDSTMISSYTAKGRALHVISNQSEADVVESVTFENVENHGADGLEYFYDAETGEEIETDGETLKLFIPKLDYRLVIGFRTPWKFAAKHAVRQPDLPPASTLDPRMTTHALVRQLLDGLDLKPAPDSHALTAAWITAIIDEAKNQIAADPENVIYYDSDACEEIDLDVPEVRTAIIHNRKQGWRLVFYDNPTDNNLLLDRHVRERIDEFLGETGHSYVIDPVQGYSFWHYLDLPANSAAIELIYRDHQDYWKLKEGPFEVGTMQSNIAHAVIEKAKTEK